MLTHTQPTHAYTTDTDFYVVAVSQSYFCKIKNNARLCSHTRLVSHVCRGLGASLSAALPDPPSLHRPPSPTMCFQSCRSTCQKRGWRGWGRHSQVICQTRTNRSEEVGMPLLLLFPFISFCTKKQKKNSLPSASVSLSRNKTTKENILLAATLLGVGDEVVLCRVVL